MKARATVDAARAAALLHAWADAFGEAPTLIRDALDEPPVLAVARSTRGTGVSRLLQRLEREPLAGFTVARSPFRYCRLILWVVRRDELLTTPPPSDAHDDDDDDDDDVRRLEVAMLRDATGPERPYAPPLAFLERVEDDPVFELAAAFESLF